MDKKEIKARKKAFKKAKRKAIRPWKFLTWFSLPLAIILVAAKGNKGLIIFKSYEK